MFILDFLYLREPGYYTPIFLFDLLFTKKCLDLNNVVIYSELDIKTITKYWKKFTKEQKIAICMHQRLTDAFINKYAEKYLFEDLIVYQKMSMETLNNCIYWMDWIMVSKYQKLSESFIRKFADKVNWTWISRYQELSESIVQEFSDKVDWFWISRRQAGFYEGLGYAITDRPLITCPDSKDRYVINFRTLNTITNPENVVSTSEELCIYPFYNDDTINMLYLIVEIHGNDTRLCDIIDQLKVGIYWTPIGTFTGNFLEAQCRNNVRTIKMKNDIKVYDILLNVFTKDVPIHKDYIRKTSQILFKLKLKDLTTKNNVVRYKISIACKSEDVKVVNDKFSPRYEYNSFRRSEISSQLVKIIAPYKLQRSETEQIIRNSDGPIYQLYCIFLENKIPETLDVRIEFYNRDIKNRHCYLQEYDDIVLFPEQQSNIDSDTLHFTFKLNADKSIQELMGQNELFDFIMSIGVYEKKIIFETNHDIEIHILHYNAVATLHGCIGTRYTFM